MPIPDHATTTIPTSTPTPGPRLVTELGSRDGGSVPNLLHYLDNDHGNAQRLVALHGSSLRYCHSFKKWLIWDGTRWLVDRTGQVVNIARHTMSETLSQATTQGISGKQDFAISSLNINKAQAMLAFAQSDLAILSEDLDASPTYNLLNFTNGTVDLRTGELAPHDPLLYITKVIDHAYDPTQDCPTWLSFLTQIMDDSQGMVDYLQSALGYTLTGRTSEKAIFVLFGEKGDNGKSTMLHTFRKLIREYSQMIQVSSLMSKEESSNSQADLADLQGARFVQTSESDEGQRLAQGRMKRLTQGSGLIKAVRKYENPIEFPETHKIWIDTNRRPVITDSGDAATFARLHPIPFNVHIPKSRQDKGLSDKLMVEAEGILAWLVQGAINWFQDGLTKPKEVIEAGKKWHADSDWMERFLQERCIVSDTGGLTVEASQLWDVYQSWSRGGGEPDLHSRTAFSKKLLDRDGISRKHTMKGDKYVGLMIRPSGTGGRVGSTPAEQSETED